MGFRSNLFVFREVPLVPYPWLKFVRIHILEYWSSHWLTDGEIELNLVYVVVKNKIFPRAGKCQISNYKSANVKIDIIIFSKHKLKMAYQVLPENDQVFAVVEILDSVINVS